jgi:hypothetical protein
MFNSEIEMQGLVRDRGWPAWAHHVKQMLGIKGAIPAEGVPEQIIQGYRVYAISLQQAKEQGVFHRVRIVCPQCAKHVPAGRIRQHKCKE